MHFSRSHLSMIVRYIGVSFITGAVSHGVFSGNRAIATGIAGIVFFIIGSLLEEWGEKMSSWKIIIAGAVLAIGIGAVTGGLQHFPDSPERSLWIIPVGFLISLVFYAKMHGYAWAKKEYVYAGVSLVGITIFSIATFFFIENSGLVPHEHHDEVISTQQAPIVQESLDLVQTGAVILPAIVEAHPDDGHHD